MRYGIVSGDTLHQVQAYNRRNWADGVRSAHIDRRPTDIDPARAMRHAAWLEYVAREDSERG